MSHVAEGELHAWLDGALDQLGEKRAEQVREHLRHCAACQEQLAAEEAVRAHAAEVLALVAPGVADMPPLETLVERARTAPAPLVAARTARMSQVARLGWAASVMVALGTGWMGRELWLRRGRVESVAARGDEAAAPASPAAAAEAPAVVRSAPALGSAPERAAERKSAGPTRVADAQPAAGESAPERTALPPSLSTGAGSAGANGEVASAPTEVVATAPGAAPATTAADDDDPPLQQGNVVVVVPPPSPEPSKSAAEPLVRSELAREANGGGSAGSAVRAPAPSPERAPAGPRPVPGRQERSASSAVPPTRADAIGIQRARPETAGSDVPDLFVQGRSTRQGRAANARPTNEADVEEALDLIVPGLDVLRVEWTEVVQGQRGLKVEQRLPSGDTLQIRFIRSGGAAADAAADPMAAVVNATQPEGWSQVVRVHGDGWIVARAKLDRAQLEALLREVGTARR